MIKVGIAGAAGYTGGELIRILLRHPAAVISFAHSNSQAGKSIASIHQDLTGDSFLHFTNDWNWNVDVLFLCVGHGESRNLLASLNIPEHVRIIDLSQDFRVDTVLTNREFMYGLPEMNRKKLQHSRYVANPGCFATALTLGLLPLAASGFKGNVYSTGITGATGAGQSLNPTSHFAWRSSNIQAYKSLNHQHMQEVAKSLNEVGSESNDVEIRFVPWRGDFARGIFVSQQLETHHSLADLISMYETYYHTHPFTHVSEEPIHLKQVVNTNKCLIQIEQHDGATVIHSAIDNLLKGASGQAIQNMNILFELDEKTGLDLKANYF